MKGTRILVVCAADTSVPGSGLFRPSGLVHGRIKIVYFSNWFSPVSMEQRVVLQRPGKSPRACLKRTGGRE